MTPNDARSEAEGEPIIGCAQLSLHFGKLVRVDEHGRVQPDDRDFTPPLILGTSLRP